MLYKTMYNLSPPRPLSHIMREYMLIKSFPRIKVLLALVARLTDCIVFLVHVLVVLGRRRMALAAQITGIQLTHDHFVHIQHVQFQVSRIVLADIAGGTLEVHIRLIDVFHFDMMNEIFSNGKRLATFLTR